MLSISRSAADTEGYPSNLPFNVNYGGQMFLKGTLGDPSFSMSSSADAYSLVINNGTTITGAGKAVLLTDPFGINTPSGTEMKLTPSTTTQASLNIGQGNAPGTPTNGDLWITSGGFYAQAGGTTYGPMGQSTQINGGGPGSYLFSGPGFGGCTGTACTFTGGYPTFGAGFIEHSTMTGTSAPYFSGGVIGYTHQGTSVTATNATSALPAMLESTSIATANDLAGWAAVNQGVYYIARAPVVTIPIGFASSADYGATNSQRILAGVAYMAGGGCTTATLMASDAPTCDFAAVRYSNAASDSTFMCVVDNAGTVTTAAITGAVPTASYPIYINVAPTTTSTVCTVTINGTAYSATVTATQVGLPTMGAFFLNQAQTSTAVHILGQGVDGHDATF
jgi:hypothetical protein